MSRIGNNPIAIPEGVTVEINDNVITVKGKLGELKQEFSGVEVKSEEGTIVVTRPSDSKEHKAKHGLYRSLIVNMVEGVSKGWTKELELVGVGYRASHQGQKLHLALVALVGVKRVVANEEGRKPLGLHSASKELEAVVFVERDLYDAAKSSVRGQACGRV